MGYLLGYDIGSSSIKAALIESETGKIVALAASPNEEMGMIVRKPGWAEQDPSIWWENIKRATAGLKCKAESQLKDVVAIGISYQMHGLVVVDRALNVLRPSIIWCDSRAVDIGEEAFRNIGKKKCLENFLNSPGNFTASKLKWVMDNEPEIFSRIHKMMLPGDFIAMKLTGEVKTTASGLSEGILWNFRKNTVAGQILDYYGIPGELLPEPLPTFGVQGELSHSAASELGLKPGIKISYRAGDQPNNALSLGVLNPGEIAATAGTSGVVYGVTDQVSYDKESRVNTFVHVNHNLKKPRYGILLCLNGTGILNSWVRKNFAGVKNTSLSYPEMNDLASQAPAGSAGLSVLPYGNGAERTLANREIGASLLGINFNVHNLSHIIRASQEGIVFALHYGLEIMREMGFKLRTIKAGNANMFLSPVFREAFANTTNTVVDIYETDGAAGAARGAGIGAGVYRNEEEAFIGLNKIVSVNPDQKLKSLYKDAYSRWKEILLARIEK